MGGCLSQPNVEAAPRRHQSSASSCDLRSSSSFVCDLVDVEVAVNTAVVSGTVVVPANNKHIDRRHTFARLPRAMSSCSFIDPGLDTGSFGEAVHLDPSPATQL